MTSRTSGMNRIRGRLNGSSLNPMTIKSVKQYHSAHKGIRVVSKLKQWVIEVNLGCSRQSLMKFVPVNSVSSASLCLYQRWMFSTLAFTFGLFIR